MMKKHGALLAVAAVVGCVALAAGCTSPSPQAQVNFDKNDPGYQVFAGSCSGCHGTDLQGGAGPNLQHVGAQLTKDQIEHQIVNGGNGMPPFQKVLDQQKLGDVLNFLTKLK